jgi:hypothetical protein
LRTRAARRDTRRVRATERLPTVRDTKRWAFTKAGASAPTSLKPWSRNSDAARGTAHAGCGFDFPWKRRSTRLRCNASCLLRARSGRSKGSAESLQSGHSSTSRFGSIALSRMARNGPAGLIQNVRSLAICAALMMATGITAAVMLRSVGTGSESERQSAPSPVGTNYRPIGGPHE